MRASALWAASQRYLGGGWLPWAIGACALVPLSLSVRGRSGPSRWRNGAPVAAVAHGCSLAALRKHAARWPQRRDGGRRAPRLDSGRLRASTWIATLAFLGCWLFESVDTAVVIRLVGGSSELCIRAGLRGRHLDAEIDGERRAGRPWGAGRGLCDAAPGHGHVAGCGSGVRPGQAGKGASCGIGSDMASWPRYADPSRREPRRRPSRAWCTIRWAASSERCLSLANHRAARRHLRRPRWSRDARGARGLVR